MDWSPEERQEIGRWLAGLYLRELDAPTLALYRSPEGARALDRLDSVPPLTQLVGALRDIAADPADPERLRLDLAAAYGRLFLTGGPRSVPLFASAFLSERGLLMQAPAQQAAKDLAQLGLVPPEGFREPADHIGIQLSLLAELAVAGPAGDLTEAGFLADRLLPWVPTFAALCARLATVPLYRELGPATLGWLRALESQLSTATAPRG